jgi:hypothetical protein
MQVNFLKTHIRRIALFIAIFLMLGSSVASAAELQFSPSTASFDVGQTFNVRAEVKPDGDSVNAVETEINFDAEKLTVVSVSKDGSAFSLWTTEPTYSNTAGTITFGGGSPTPFSDTSTLLTITFRGKAPGAAEVDYNGGSVLAADGLGTDVLTGSRLSTYTINEAPEVEAPPPPPPPSGDGPEAPVVISASHADEDKWYAEDTAEFQWNIPPGVTSVRLLLGSQPDTVPTVPYTPPITQRIIDNLDEGVSYLHVQFEDDTGWGAITHRKVQVDLSPPDEFEIIAIEAEASTTPPSLSFLATDAVSGIARYEIEVEGQDVVTITPEELEALPNQAWEMPRLFDGGYLVIIRAFDLADNVTEVSETIELSTGLVEEVDEGPVAVVEEDKGLNIWLVISLILLLIIFFLIGVIYVQRSRFLKERDYLRRETREIRDKMEKIFTVLQDELEEQISSLDGKPRLSAAEKRVLSSLREALEVSEAFINKEIEDVEKILK